MPYFELRSKRGDFNWFIRKIDTFLSRGLIRTVNVCVCVAVFRSLPRPLYSLRRKFCLYNIFILNRKIAGENYCFESCQCSPKWFASTEVGRKTATQTQTFTVRIKPLDRKVSIFRMNLFSLWALNFAEV
jgi:hypothetical protein